MKAIMVMVYNSFSFYLISFVRLCFFRMIQLGIPSCSYIQTESIEFFCLYMVSILF